MKFYDLNLMSNLSSGENSIAEMAERAEMFGYDAIAFCDYLLNLKDLEKMKREIKTAKKKCKIEIYAGVKIKSDNKAELVRKVRAFREHVYVIAVQGGNLEVNGQACAMPEVDILASPESGRIDSGFDHVMASLARENRVALAIEFFRILDSESKSRISTIRKIRKNLRICEKYNVPVISSSGAKNVWEIRGPREMMAFIEILGFDYEFAEKSLTSNSEVIIQRAKEVFSKGFIAPGVKRLDKW